MNKSLAPLITTGCFVKSGVLATKPTTLTTRTTLSRSPINDLIAAIALIAAARLGGPVTRPAPLYIRSADAAPPRDPAPTILA